MIAFRLAMRTSYREIALLACCQALLLINNAGLIAMNALVALSARTEEEGRAMAARLEPRIALQDEALNQARDTDTPEAKRRLLSLLRGLREPPHGNRLTHRDSIPEKVRRS